jgi:hypothetical protein
LARGRVGEADLTYQRSALLAHSGHGGHSPCLPSQTWAAVLAPLLSGAVGIRFGGRRTGVPPHYARTIIRLLEVLHLISLFVTPTSQRVQYSITAIGFSEHFLPLLSTHMHLKHNGKLSRHPTLRYYDEYFRCSYTIKLLSTVVLFVVCIIIRYSGSITSKQPAALKIKTLLYV